VAGENSVKIFGRDLSELERLSQSVKTEIGALEVEPRRRRSMRYRRCAIDIDCPQLGAVLVNDVTACAPGEPGACLDGLGLSSRVKALRLYK
jgi:hypothetical protein